MVSKKVGRRCNPPQTVLTTQIEKNKTISIPPSRYNQPVRTEYDRKTNSIKSKYPATDKPMDRWGIFEYPSPKKVSRTASEIVLSYHNQFPSFINFERIKSGKHNRNSPRPANVMPSCQNEFSSPCRNKIRKPNVAKMIAEEPNVASRRCLDHWFVRDLSTSEKFRVILSLSGIVPVLQAPYPMPPSAKVLLDDVANIH